MSETWVERDVPQVKVDFLADPEGKHPKQHADARDEDNTDPEHPSDMKYQRWYPAGAVLPNKKLLILNGTDQDSSLGPSTGIGRPCASGGERALLQGAQCHARDLRPRGRPHHRARERAEAATDVRSLLRDPDRARPA